MKGFIISCQSPREKTTRSEEGLQPVGYIAMTWCSISSCNDSNEVKGETQYGR